MTGLPEPSVQEVQHELDRVTEFLADRFGTIDRATVRRFVTDTYDQLARQATVRTHLIALTERAARDRLRDHAAE
ncbi:hypothetical protein [Alloactinosynnema sp. L-07]|uniref:three-helix bundle dimerization domain-containing protein n=1 Tax=Alloactinosynnema sp. L-07 TaxID=1653480 RepID=UPI00065EFE73|nr:hypothetical protein [Alloactinosynnema sp. L-07]CRK58270.1 hypothetical protein [Alloactinosynnema sp. L-07]